MVLGDARLRVFRRLAVSLVAVLLPTMAVASPSSAAAASDASCSPVVFLGAHGVGEGASGMSPDAAHWGGTVQQVWHTLKQTLNQNGVLVAGEAVSYPKVPVPTNVQGLAGLNWLLGPFRNSSMAGNTSLMNEMTDTYNACHGTRFVLAGYSQGAWIVDYVLHYFESEKGHGGPSIGHEILADVKGVFLMGDPAWPVTAQTPNLDGLVTYYGSKMSALLPQSVYPTEKAYLANGVPTSDFWSICAGGDPVCHFDGSWIDFNKNVKIHKHAYSAGNPQGS